MSTFAARMVHAAGLDVATFEEIEADTTANTQAILVVILANVCAAIGLGATRGTEFIGIVVGAILSWMVWVGLTLIIGTQLLPGNSTRSNFGEILRTTGFSIAPGVLRIFGGVPIVGWLIFSIATVWMLASFVVAIRQALDYTSTSRALAVCILGWLIHGIIFFGFVRVAV